MSLFPLNVHYPDKRHKGESHNHAGGWKCHWNMTPVLISNVLLYPFNKLFPWPRLFFNNRTHLLIKNRPLNVLVIFRPGYIMNVSKDITLTFTSNLFTGHPVESVFCQWICSFKDLRLSNIDLHQTRVCSYFLLRSFFLLDCSHFGFQ